MLHTFIIEILINFDFLPQFRFIFKKRVDSMKKIHSDVEGQPPQMAIHPNIEGRKAEGNFLSPFYHPLFQIFLFPFKKCLIEVNPLIVSHLLFTEFNGNLLIIL